MIWGLGKWRIDWKARGAEVGKFLQSSGRREELLKPYSFDGEKEIRELMKKMEIAITNPISPTRGDSQERMRAQDILDQILAKIRFIHKDQGRKFYPNQLQAFRVVGFEIGKLIGRANNEKQMSLGISHEDRILIPWRDPRLNG